MTADLWTFVAVALALAAASAALAADAPAERASAPHAAAPADVPHTGGNFALRGSLHNCRAVFTALGRGHVAFMGGSITEMNGYRPRVMEMLKRAFPDTAFTFTDAGIASTCSTTGAMRLERDVLAHGPADLFFVEFAVNDDQDAHHARRECIRGMEGIVRHVRRHNPKADIVITHFVNPEMLAACRAGQTPLTVEAHEAVARHYDISSVNLAQETADLAGAGRLTWQQFGGTHPGPVGNDMAAGMAWALLTKAWAAPPPAGCPVSHPLPAPLDALSYERGRLIEPKAAVVKGGWSLGVPDWKALAGSKRDRFTSIEMLHATAPGAELTLAFDGTAVGAYVAAGPDAGMLDARIDGGPPVRVNLYHDFSKGLHYPRTVMFAADLAPGRHTLVLRVADETSSAGHAARIIAFAAN